MVMLKKKTALKAFALTACCAVAGTLLGIAVTKAMGTQRVESGAGAARVVDRTISEDAQRLLRTPGAPPMSPLQAQEAVDHIRLMTTYRGTQINPDAVKGLPFQRVRKAFAEAMKRLDPLPQARLQHFDWVTAELNPKGWVGHISAIQQVPNGWVVELRVSPDLLPGGGVVQTPDQCVERYAVSADGAINLIPFEHEHPNRGALIQD